MHKMAKELGVGGVRRIVKKKLLLRSYQIVRGHLLNERMKAKLVAAGHLSKVLFTDEKTFTVELESPPPA